MSIDPPGCPWCIEYITTAALRSARDERPITPGPDSARGHPKRFNGSNRGISRSAHRREGPGNLRRSLFPRSADRVSVVVHFNRLVQAVSRLGRGVILGRQPVVRFRHSRAQMAQFGQSPSSAECRSVKAASDSEGPRSQSSLPAEVSTALSPSCNPSDPRRYRGGCTLDSCLSREPQRDRASVMTALAASKHTCYPIWRLCTAPY
jgi:hypothetical protein